MTLLEITISDGTVYSFDEKEFNGVICEPIMSTMFAGSQIQKPFLKSELIGQPAKKEIFDSGVDSTIQRKFSFNITQWDGLTLEKLQAIFDDRGEHQISHSAIAPDETDNIMYGLLQTGYNEKLTDGYERIGENGTYYVSTLVYNRSRFNV